MSERSRNLFVLLLVLGLIAGSAVAIATKETKLGLDLQGGVELVYEGKPTRAQPTLTQEAMARAVDIIRERVDALGVAEPEITTIGQELIGVALPAVENAERAAEQVGTTAQMAFYDWEPNILDEDCKADPTVNANERQPIVGFLNAVKLASKCPAERDGNNTNASSERVYGFNKGGQPLNDQFPAPTEAELYEGLESRPERIPGTDPPKPRFTGDAINEKQEGDQIFTVPEGILIVRQERPPSAPGEDPKPKPDAWFVIKDNPVLSGTDIKDPEQNFDPQSNEPIVTMNFTEKGKEAFAATTRAIAERGADNALPGQSAVDASHHFAIVLDNELVSTPYINFRENPDGIDGETGAQISGGFNITSAQDLAKFLKIGALPIELELISRSQVSATLGRQALDEGLVAGLAGFAIVALFLLVFYRVLGLIAVSALAVYGVYLFALIKLIPVVMTLPGIAGMILTLGVAADANIVVFERVKEEVRAGRSIAAGIANGYKKGFATILDANIVTLLVAFILFILATAGVKGFALLLGLGTVVSLFTAVLATQAILLSLRNTRVVSSRMALGAGEQKFRWRYDFMGASKWFFSMSGIIVLIGAFGIAGKGLNLGIDFASGTRVQVALAEPGTVERVREVLQGTGYANAEVQAVTDPDVGENLFQISTATLRPEQVARVHAALDAEFGTETELVDTQSIGPTFGKSIANSALIAIIASLAVISVYLTLRFQWKFAIPVLIALVHDLLITAGIYALVGREVTASTVAALLTILGFSLYDTIIVFDRIRENMPRMPAATFSQIVNRSMSEVLTRSLATSFCTALPVFGLLVFGGDTLKDFAFALLIGTLSGTYSSVFIAGQVLTHWKEREPVFKARRARILAALGHVPAYATAVGGEPVDVTPQEKRRLTTPSDPAQVSADEFEEMVRNLGTDAPPPVAPPRRGPAGGRRKTGERKPPPSDGGGAPASGGAADGGADPASGDGAAEKPKQRPTGGRRARKPHGRSR